MTINKTVKLLEGTDHQGRRCTLLWREDIPESVACFGVGETDRVRTLIDNSITRGILCQWHFAGCPIWDFDKRVLVAEYSLNLKGRYNNG